jgi:hypothetical protein
MGYGNYSAQAHDQLLQRRSQAPASEVFSQQNCHPLMNPKGVLARESRDGPDHPDTHPVVFALDVTGSMGDLPRLMATRELPSFMRILQQCSVPDPQLLFMAVGDAYSDRAPLQVGQFESTAELMDQWLTRSVLEGGGGGTGEESYELAMYFLAQHTELDSVVKRKKRGYLFMTGDENPYATLSRHVVENFVGDRLDDDLKVEEIVAELQKTFVPFFVVPDERRRGNCEAAWRDLLGDHVLLMSDPADICFVSAGAMLLCEGIAKSLDEVGQAFDAAGVRRERRGPALSALKRVERLYGEGRGVGGSLASKAPAGPVERVMDVLLRR